MPAESKTTQLETWTSEFGKEYTDRNPATWQDYERVLMDYYGARKTEIFQSFLGPERLSSGRVLEVGCNVGHQLAMLHSINPGLQFYGIEPQDYARARAKELYPNFHFLPGSAFDLPFKDGFFDVVMTNGVLIHIDPSHLGQALAEIYRCSQQYVFGHEYFAESEREIRYYGNDNLLWKLNYMKAYQGEFPDLEEVKLRYLHYREPDKDEDLIDQVFLLRKPSR